MNSSDSHRPARRARSAAGRVKRRLQGTEPLRAEVVELRRQVRRLEKRLARLEKQGGSGSGERPTDPVRIGPVQTPVDDRVERVITQVRDSGWTFLKIPSLRTLSEAVREVDRTRVPGLLVETGTAQGGSAIVMAATKVPGRRMKVYDVFDTIPAPSERDGADVHERYGVIASGQAAGRGGETYYGYRDDLLGEVTASFAAAGVPVEENDVELIKGLFQDTIDLDEPVALAHLDGDWYDSTMTCLERIAPLLSPGGRLVIDDYDAYSGCRDAINDYFAKHAGYRFERRGKLHVVKP